MVQLEIVTRRSDGSMEKSRNDVPGHAFPSMFSWRMKMSCGERHVMRVKEHRRKAISYFGWK